MLVRCFHTMFQRLLFQEFLELTVETDSDQPLPPPKEVAKKLRSQAIQTVQTWQSTYGAAYKKLALGYHFLKQVKKVRERERERGRPPRSGSRQSVVSCFTGRVSDTVCCQVDFQDAEARTVAERRREEERRRRLERLYKDKVEAATKDMDGKHRMNPLSVHSLCFTAVVCLLKCFEKKRVFI